MGLYEQKPPGVRHTEVGPGTGPKTTAMNVPAAIQKRNNVHISGTDGKTALMFSHGFGCDQHMWRFVAPAFENDFQVVLFDHVGAGNSDLASYSYSKYDDLEGYAKDVIEIAEALDLHDAVFIGHSVSAMIGVIAAKMAPEVFKALVLVAPSPCYLDDGEYNGGFTRDQIEDLLKSLESNHLGWSMTMAPAIMGHPDRPELGDALANSFCRTDPAIARHFARVTFLSDKRSDLEGVSTPCLILQCSQDIIAPEAVGDYMHRKLTNSTLVNIRATGHCPNLSAPEETVAAVRSFLVD